MDGRSVDAAPAPADGWPSRLARCGLVALFFEVTITGSGQIFRLGPITLRNLLIAVIFLLALPAIARSWRCVVRDRQVLLTAALGGYFAASAAWGLAQGHRVAAVAADLTTLVALILVPAVLVLCRTRQQLARFVDAFLIGSFLLAMSTTVVHFLGAFGLVNVRELGGFLSRHQVGLVSNVGDLVIRVFLRSQVILLVSLPLAIHAVATRRRPRLMLVVATVMAFALLASLTRSLLLGAGVACLLAVMLGTLTRVTWRAGLQVGIALLLLVGLSTAAYQRPVLVEALGTRMSASVGRELANPDTSSEQASRQLREATFNAQWRLFTQRPILGWGLGKGIPEIRDDHRTEFMYLDYGVKTGIVGIVGFLLTFLAVPVSQLVGNLRRRPVRAGQAQAVQALATCALGGLAVSSLLNPFLNNTLGISVLLLGLAAGAGQPASAIGDEPPAASGADGTGRAVR